MATVRWNIPDDWSWKTIEQLGNVRGGGTPSSSKPNNFSDADGFSWVTPSDLSGHSDTYITRGRRNLTEAGLKASGAQLLPLGTVLFSSRAPIGYCVVAAKPLATSQGCKNIVLHEDHVPEYLMHYLRYSKVYAESQASGSTFLELSAAKVRTLSVPVPPREQQEAIALALEDLLNRIRLVRNEVQQLPDLAEAQANEVLSLAYEGALTEDWRNSCGARAWGKASLADVLAIPIRNGLSVRGHDAPPGVRALKLSALRSRQVDLEDVRFLPISDDRARRYWLADGDILVARGSGTRGFVGRAAVVKALDELTIFPDTAFRLRADPTKVSPAWLVHILNAPQLRSKVKNAARTTAGIWKVRQGDISELELNIPTLEEQHKVVEIVDRALGQIDQIRTGSDNVQRLLNRFESSILDLAFRGGLDKAKVVQRIPLTLEQIRLEAAGTIWRAGVPRINREGSVKMSRATKSRFSVEVRDKPYLAAIISKQPEVGSSAKLLFSASELSISDFYKQLSWEVGQGSLVETSNGFLDGR